MEDGGGAKQQQGNSKLGVHHYYYYFLIKKIRIFGSFVGFLAVLLLEKLFHITRHFPLTGVNFFACVLGILLPKFLTPFSDLVCPQISEIVYGVGRQGQDAAEHQREAIPEEKVQHCDRFSTYYTHNRVGITYFLKKITKVKCLQNKNACLFSVFLREDDLL